MDSPIDLERFETTFARLAFDFASATDSKESMKALLAAQRATLLQPFSSALELVSSLENEGGHLELQFPSGLEILRRLTPVVSEFLIESVRNWKAHGRPASLSQSVLSENGLGKGRVLILARILPSGLQVEFHDDGPGLNPKALLDRLVSMGSISASELVNYERAAQTGNFAPLYSLLFRDGITTRIQANGDAGRGIGLARVQQKAIEIGGGVMASASPVLGGFKLALTLPCAVIALSARPAGSGLVEPLFSSRLSGSIQKEGESYIFYRLPEESLAWSKQQFSNTPVFWISLQTETQDQPKFSFLGLQLNSAGV